MKKQIAIGLAVLAVMGMCLPAEAGIDTKVRKWLDEIYAGQRGLGRPKLNSISEQTTDAGVTIDGVLLKDGSVGSTGGTLGTANGTFTLHRSDAGTVTLNVSDDAGTCDLVINAGGAGTITLGAASVTTITVGNNSSESKFLMRSLPCVEIHVAAVTNGQAIAAVWPAYNLTAVANCTNTIAAPRYKGQLLELAKTQASTTTVTFADSGNLKLTGNFAIGQDDTLLLRSFDGTNWWEMGRSAN